MGETTKGESQSTKPHPQTTQQISSSSSPKESLDQETPQSRLLLHHHHQSFISSPIYIPVAGLSSSSSPFETAAAAAINPKRPRYGGSASSSATPPSQWKTIPSPTSSEQPKQTHTVVFPTDTSTNPISPPSSSAAAAAAAASSSETAGSSPPPRPEKPETEPCHHQLRKGKYVSPVWKPNEMLWLARAWRLQYQAATGSGHENPETGQPGRGKTRAEKDREVAEFLNRNGINRDAKTAGTKWDNMLGEFRKVYEWERGGEREKLSGKSYFRLSPYERKQHRLPASFDEEVFEELAQFMGPRVRAPSSRGATLPLPPPPPPPPCSRDDEMLVSSGKHIICMIVHIYTQHFDTKM